MMFNRGLFQKFEQLKARHIEQSEFTAKELNSVRKRISTLEKQVTDGMNREEEWKRRLAKIETGIIVDQMKVDGVWKDEGPNFNIAVGDLVVDKRNPTRIRTVTQLNADRIKLENGSMQGIYSGADWIINFQFDWKLLVKKEDFK